MEPNMICKGCIVEILPEFQDLGDEQFMWISVDDAEKGRVNIAPVGTVLTFPPVHAPAPFGAAQSWNAQEPANNHRLQKVV